MSIEYKIAGWIIASVLFVFYSLLVCISNYNDDKKKKRNKVIHLFCGIAVSACSTIIGAVLFEPVVATTKEGIIIAVEHTEGFVKIIMHPFANQESDDNTDESNDETESDSDDDDLIHELNIGRNRLVYHPYIPVKNRVLTPENTLYPDIDMESIDDLLNSGGNNYRGYQGATRRSVCVTYAFESPTSDPDGLYEELKIEILKNPLVGDMIVQGLAYSYPEFENEPLMKDFLTACNDAYSRSEEPHGLDSWLTCYKFKDGEKAIFVTDEYRRYAEALCQLLDKFTNYGVHNFDAKAYYDRSFSVLEYSRTNLVKETFSLPALVLYKSDDNGKIICAIGFDLDGKDLFIYNPDVIP